jgi:hypothetical protein
MASNTTPFKVPQSFRDEFIELYLKEQRRKEKNITKIADILSYFGIEYIVQRSVYNDKPKDYILKALFDLAVYRNNRIPPVDDFTTNFPSEVYELYGYQFALIFGQGTQQSIYKNNQHVVTL